jgi:hypothetical protein
MFSWTLVFDGMLVGMWHPKFMWTLYVVLIFIGFALSAHGVLVFLFDCSTIGGRRKGGH